MFSSRRLLCACVLVAGLSSSVASAGGPPANSVLNDASRPPVYGFYGPTYRWGWFGVQYRPMMVHHRGYYGHFYEWGYRCGY